MTDVLRCVSRISFYEFQALINHVVESDAVEETTEFVEFDIKFSGVCTYYIGLVLVVKDMEFPQVIDFQGITMKGMTADIWKAVEATAEVIYCGVGK